MSAFAVGDRRPAYSPAHACESVLCLGLLILGLFGVMLMPGAALYGQQGAGGNSQGVELPEDVDSWTEVEFTAARDANHENLPKAARNLAEKKRGGPDSDAAIDMLYNLLKLPEAAESAAPAEGTPDGYAQLASPLSDPATAEPNGLDEVVDAIGSFKTDHARQVLLELIQGKAPTHLGDRRAVTAAFQALTKYEFGSRDSMADLLDFVWKPKNYRKSQPSASDDENADNGAPTDLVSPEELRTWSLEKLAEMDESAARSKMAAFAAKNKVEPVLELILRPESANAAAQLELYKDKSVASSLKKRLDSLFASQSGACLAALMGLKDGEESSEESSAAEGEFGAAPDEEGEDPDETVQYTPAEAKKVAAGLWGGPFAEAQLARVAALKSGKGSAGELLLPATIPTVKMRAAIQEVLNKRGQRADEFVLDGELFASQPSDPAIYPVVKMLVRDKKPKPRVRNEDSGGFDTGNAQGDEEEVPPLKMLLDRLLERVEASTSSKANSKSLPFKLPANAKISKQVHIELKADDVKGVDISPTQIHYFAVTQRESFRNLNAQYRRQLSKPLKESEVGDTLWLDKIEQPSGQNLMRSVDVLIREGVEEEESEGEDDQEEAADEEGLSEDRIKKNFSIRILIVEIPKPVKKSATQNTSTK